MTVPPNSSTSVGSSSSKNLKAAANNGRVNSDKKNSEINCIVDYLVEF